MKLVDVAPGDARLLRLLQLYIYEWTALLPSLPLPNADGSFTYPKNIEHHRAVLFVDDASPIGFALTNVEDGVGHVEEFFVIAGVRRRGIGAHAAAALFAGALQWTFTVRPENPRALSFWRSVTSSFRDRHESVEVGDDGIARTRFRFAVSSAP